MSRTKLCACHAHFRLHCHRLSGRLHAFGGDKSTLGGESPASMVIAVADVAQVVASDATQSARQPTPGPILQEQNQTDRMLERSQDRAEEQEDFLTIQD
jgi:hypothetical protein